MKKEATDLAEHLRATVLSSWEKTVKRLGGLSKTRVLHGPFAVKYYEEITKGFTAVAGGLRVPDTYYNRVSIIKSLLSWLNLAFPLTINRGYNEKMVISMLVACDPETIDDLGLDFQMGEHSEEYEEMLTDYFREEGKEHRMLCLTALLEFLHFSFAKDGYNRAKIQETTCYLYTLVGDPL
ncbi:unnamed protein product [Rhizopus stolonifer]